MNLDCYFRRTITKAVGGLSILAALVGWWPGHANPLLTLDSQCLSDGILEYRLTFSGKPYLECNGLTRFQVSFLGFSSALKEPVDWTEAPGFPVGPQLDALLRWEHDGTRQEPLPYSCAFQVRSQKSAYRAGTAEISYFLHWNDWAQPPNLRTNLQGTATLECLIPCDPEQSDGRAPLCQASASGFPQLNVEPVPPRPPDLFRLGITARAGLPICVEASEDLRCWRRVGYLTASAGMSDWASSQTAPGGAQFYRAVVRTPDFAHPEDLVSSQWLEHHLADPDLRIVDARYPQSQEAFRSGHIPGAVKVDPATDLADPTRSPLYLVPSVAQFEALMGRLGISTNTTVVVYDTDGGLWCARLWWALRYYGHQPVKLLHGGLRKWQSEKRPTETQVTSPNAATFKAQVHTELRATMAEVKAAIGNTNVIILDALSVSHHNGTSSDMPSLPAGHIPSAKNVPAQSNLDPANWVLRLPPETLAALYQAAGLTPDKQVITYCGGGYYGAFSLFVLHQLGYENVRLYDGSWVEWTSKGGAIATGP